MAAYFDSSLILSALFEEREDLDYDSLWRQDIRLSSNILKIEGIIGIRRAGQIQKLQPEDPWVQQRIIVFEQYVTSMNLKYLDQDIEQAIQDEPRYAGCRTLDAIHLATAGYFQKKLNQTVWICTLDLRMRTVAQGLGFKLLPRKV